MRKALAAAVLLLAACDDLLSADLRIPSIDVTLPGQEFPESETPNIDYWCDPADNDPPCLAVALDYDLGGQVPVLDEPGVTYDLRLTHLALTLSATQRVSGEKDLSGVTTATIRVLEDPALPGSGAVLATYVRPPVTGPVSSIAVSGNANLDVGAYLEAGHLPIRVELLFDNATPTPAFDADVRAMFSLEVNLDYDALL